MTLRKRPAFLPAFTPRTAPSDPLAVSWGRAPGAWIEELDGKAWAYAVLSYVSFWPGSSVRAADQFIGAAIAFSDKQQIAETDICSGGMADRARKGKWNITLDIAPTVKAADERLALARELTHGGGTIAIMAPVVWASRMLLDVAVEPAVYVLDERIGGRTIAWFVWDRSDFMGRWRRLAKDK